MEDKPSEISLKELNITEAENDEIDDEGPELDETDTSEIHKAETASVSSSNNDSGSGDVNNDHTDAATFDSNSDSASASGVSAEWTEYAFDVRRVELEEGRRGFGFSISGGVMSPLGHVPLFVASVDPHGPAAKTDMKPGDRIITINGENMETKSHRDAIISIKAACGPVAIELTQGEENILDFIIMD